jgi:hypothetical protein
MFVNGKKTYHRQVVYRTARLPNTGPIFNPASSDQMYKEVPKLFARPTLQMSLTIPDVIFASTPEQAPVIMRVTTKVAKFCAAA